jgi:hypothetical protein
MKVYGSWQASAPSPEADAAHRRAWGDLWARREVERHSRRTDLVSDGLTSTGARARPRVTRDQERAIRVAERLVEMARFQLAGGTR